MQTQFCRGQAKHLTGNRYALAQEIELYKLHATHPLCKACRFLPEVMGENKICMECRVFVERGGTT